MRRQQQDGHLLGFHTATPRHSNHRFLSPAELEQSLRDGVADLSAMTVFCLSDGLVDRHDRMYVGDIGYNFFDPANQPVDTCVITCIESDGSTRIGNDSHSFLFKQISKASICW